MDRTKHLKVWISYAKFEASAVDYDSSNSGLTEDEVQIRKKECIEHARGELFDEFHSFLCLISLDFCACDRILNVSSFSRDF